ncbi:unnamed protein product [Soboliphyme baturini]|uniref:G_PROTEIN_RECEP_F1_2 domain-containing protein n=1 Tax=Soboliphyme baturini TaxID=241478 RepID=A0A183IAT3_9BILA|nr:unnamed protein product [Soboliphyme baturini]
MNRWECLLKRAHVTLYNTGEDLMSSLLLLISLDRFVAMVSTEMYGKLSRKTVLLLLNLVVMSALIDGLFIWTYILLDGGEMVSAMCLQNSVVPRLQYFIHVYFMLFASYASVVIYVAAIICSRMQRQADVYSWQLKREMIVTKRLAFIIISNFVLNAVPLTVFTSVKYESNIFEVLNLFIWRLTSLDQIMQILLYAWLHPDVHKCMANLFRSLLRQNQIQPQEQTDCM